MAEQLQGTAASSANSSWFDRWLASLFENRLLLSSDNHPSTPPSRSPTSSPGPETLPAMADDAVHFCAEDTVGLKDDKNIVGFVDRSFGDVDTHEPRPQREYDTDIERHRQVPKEQFKKFMRDGIPPRGTVLVSWQHVVKVELVPESCLELLDRALYVGDVVKRSAKDPMSGTVIGTKATCTLFPMREFHPEITAVDMMASWLREVPASEVINVHEITEQALVVYKNWVGRVEEVVDDVAVQLSNKSVVVVDNPDELEPDDPGVERLTVGDKVKTKKGNLRRGRWEYGAFTPEVPPVGTVVETRTKKVIVHWLAKRLGANTDSDSEPSHILERDELQSSDFRVYDASCALASALPTSENGIDLSYHVADVAVGDRVRFKDLAAAADKYDSQSGQGRLVKIPRTETLGYDMNVYIVMQTKTSVTVRWQDLSITEDSSRSLIPDPNVSDDDEVWPGEIVCSKEERNDKSEEFRWTFEPARVGVVQSVQSRDRIATVRWFKDPLIRFLATDLIPPSQTGDLGDETEEVSLYDIRSIPTLTRRRGDFVMIHPGADTHTPSAEPDWFGEIIDLGLDGKLTVRLGVARPVRDIRISSENVILVYSSDDDDHLGFGAGVDDDLDYSDEDASDSGSENYNEMWIEYEGMEGQPVNGSFDDADWSTEDEEADEDDDDDDEEMPDLEDLPPKQEPVLKPRAPVSQPRLTRSGASFGADVPKDDQMDMDTPANTKHPSPVLQNGDHAPPTAQDAAVADSEAPAPFLVLETSPPANHHYLNEPSVAPSAGFMKRMGKEHRILQSSLPPGIFVRTWESRLDLIRVLMIGPSDTPYEYAPFVIDFHMGHVYPRQAPTAFFHSWTNGNGPVNPNLYEDGKICLSLLGTWHTDERNEAWSPTKSTLLQVLVSIHSLVLNRDPYYNEAGYDVHREAPETKLASALYSERSYFRARGFIVHALTQPGAVEPFVEELKYLYLTNKEGAPQLLLKAIAAAKEIMQRSETDDQDGERDGLTRMSRGAVVMLKRQVEQLKELTKRIV